MDALLAAFIGDLASRSLSFLIDRCLKKEEPSKEERLDGLQRLLLRVRVIVEEAGERHVTNQAMLQQLTTLRKEMYRGYYTLDTVRCQSHKDDSDGVGADHTHRLVSRRSFALSRFNPAKRVLFSGTGSSSGTGSDDGAYELKQVLWSLETAIADVSECIVFLSTCPRLPSRQPYNMHLILDTCMFGRQMELQHIVTFLLQTACCHGSDEPGVLPIIGPKKVGKSTLVEHACNDERVRDHFSQIVYFTRNDIAGGDERSAIGGMIKHRNCHLEGDQQRMLIVVELDGDRLSTENLDEDVVEVLWHRLYSAYKKNVPRGSKIIVTSRSGKIASFGTTAPLRLHFFPKEAYWYFFKVLAFGTMDAAEHPKLASIAMDMAVVMNGCFLGANTFGRLLRSNADARFWSAVLATLRSFDDRKQIKIQITRLCKNFNISQTLSGTMKASS